MLTIKSEYSFFIWYEYWLLLCNVYLYLWGLVPQAFGPRIIHCSICCILAEIRTCSQHFLSSVYRDNRYYACTKIDNSSLVCYIDTRFTIRLRCFRALKDWLFCSWNLKTPNRTLFMKVFGIHKVCDSVYR